MSVVFGFSLGRFARINAMLWTVFARRIWISVFGFLVCQPRTGAGFLFCVYTPCLDPCHLLVYHPSSFPFHVI